MAVLTVVALVCAAFGALLVAGMVIYARRRQLLRSLGLLLSGLFLFALAALGGTVSVGVKGYRALTAEEVAARVRTEPTGPQRFRATVELPDGRVGQFDVAGDQLYVDAHILKWKPLVNLLGLRTGYELDRVGGRYVAVADERQRPHTVFPLGPDRPVDVYGFVRRHPRVLAPLVDATYGSGTFVGADQPGWFEVRVSTTGLLIRPLPDSTAAPR
ncbi:MAG TPA: hypothetical protein VIV56_05730 [Gemmatimonadales bacterium]